MPRYLRSDLQGGMFFLTIVTHHRRSLFLESLARECLHGSIDSVRRIEPFELIEITLLPDHLHLLIRLPESDSAFSSRVSRMKSTFTRSYLAAGGEVAAQSASRERQGYRGIWQKRFWEHTVRGKDDLARIEQYIWFNPVKHKLCRCPHHWPWSSFHRAVSEGRMKADWCCVCEGQSFDPPADIPGAEMD